MNAHNTYVWFGKSGDPYAFKVFNWPETFFPSSGIYIFCKFRQKGQWEPIYVGETVNISTRFDDHHKMNCIQRYGATHIHILGPIEVEPQRRTIEEDLILNYGPPCNG